MSASSDSGAKKPSSVEKNTSEKHQTVEVSAREIDTGAALVTGNMASWTQQRRYERKVDFHILPLMCSTIQFMDKTTLGSSAILGIIKANHLTVNQLGTIFYLSYLVFEFPQNLALQPLNCLQHNIFMWGVALCSHAACKSFGGLFVVRLILGMCEGFMIVSSMFYTRTEQTVRVGYWSQIISSFISFGTLHIKTTTLEPWQWLMIITGILTLVTSIVFWFCFPDSPTNAWFLNPQERVVAILRLQENQTGVENKHFKKEQMIEALTDPKTWLFALFSTLSNVPNSNQLSLIVSSFGFTVLQTTLLGCVGGVVEILTIWAGVTISAKTGSRAWVAFIFYLPPILGTILVSTLPWSNKVGLMLCVYINVISLSWLSSVTAGHTKRITTNAIMLGAYCIGNAAGPFMWQEKYKPRNRVPWIVIGVCYVCCMVLVLAIRYLLVAENKRRDVESRRDDRYDDVWIETLAKDGLSMEKAKVDKEFLDLTDIQNRDFRYVY
ncbi:MFS general substrate transporter [Mycena olivaceomarginata]|nr:MFS general substrate transporter [Mycena olivaceomarginata]